MPHHRADDRWHHPGASLSLLVPDAQLAAPAIEHELVVMIVWFHWDDVRLVATLHRVGIVKSMDVPTRPLKVPISAAAERGVSWLNEAAQKQRIVLTRFGKPGAVIDSAERLDETARTVSTTRREIVEQLADLARGRAKPHSLDDVCARLGIDIGRVHQRAHARRAGG